MVRRLNAGRRSAFTLLELIIVLAVLAALAALVVPILGWVREQSKFATAAAGAAEALNNLEIYKAATGYYPGRMDSLVNTSGTVYTKLYEGSGGTFRYGTVMPAGPGYTMYNGGGPRSVINHTETASDPNASSDTNPVVDIYVPGAATQPTVPMLVIDANAAVSPYKTKAQRIVRTAFPNQTDAANPTVPTGHTLVVMGIGNRCQTTGGTMTAAPTHSGAQPNTYARFLAVYDVSSLAGRGRCQLKMVLDSEFEILAKNVSNYSTSGPSDDAGVYVPPTPPTPPTP